MDDNNIVSDKYKNKKYFGKVLVIILIIGIILGCLYWGYSKYSAKQQAEAIIARDLKYEVLDESALHTDTLKQWVSENKEIKGVHSTFDNEYTYILISGGKQDTTGYGISLEKLNGQIKNIGVQYKVIAPDNPNIIEKTQSYPNMVIRLPKDKRTIKEEITK